MKPTVSHAPRFALHRPPRRPSRRATLPGGVMLLLACTLGLLPGPTLRGDTPPKPKPPAAPAAADPAKGQGAQMVVPQDPTNFAESITVSPFAAGAFQSGSGESAAGGGLNMEHLFTEQVGIGVNYAVYAFDDEVHTVSADMVLRYPVSKAIVAPYLLVGGGVAADQSGSQAVYRLGGGLDVNLLQPSLGVFADGVYNWVEGDKDFTIARLGVRLPF